MGGSGTAGADVSNGIYGLFQLEGVGLSIVPLLYFENRNEGLNYIFSEQETEVTRSVHDILGTNLSSAE